MVIQASSIYLQKVLTSLGTTFRYFYYHPGIN